MNGGFLFLTVWAALLWKSFIPNIISGRICYVFYQQQESMWPLGHLTLVHVSPATGWGPSALIIDRLYRSSSTDFDKEEGHSYRCLDSNVGDNLLQKLLNINCYLVLKSSVPKSFDVY